MMRYTVISCLIIKLLFIVNSCIAQGGAWVWMKGDSAQARAVYGIKGIADIHNTPGKRYNAANWIDSKGNLWLFGGMVDTMGFRMLSDLWKYNPLDNTWTWMTGPDTISDAPNKGFFGNKGIPDIRNNPTAKPWGYATWTDKNDCLWLYEGGGESGSSNALWRYQISTNEWTWINGSNDALHGIPVYGDLQQPAIDNSPGFRSGSSTWIDMENNLWLFGGISVSEHPNGVYADMWKYNIGNNQWTWMAGPQGVSLTSSYGLKGISNSSNLPPERLYAVSWQDLAGNFYLFGGSASTLPDKCYNDLWMFNPVTCSWTWVAGEQGINLNGSYSQYCNAEKGDEPSARMNINSVQQQPFCNNIAYLFGGVNGQQKHMAPQSGTNDLWAINLDNFKWQWLSGSKQQNTLGYYGSKGVISVNNQIPSRQAYCQWIAADGVVWIFGGIAVDSIPYSNGTGNSFLCKYQAKNDLWKFVPDTSCVHVKPCPTPDLGINIFIPNAFSPNGDGNNDRFNVFGKEITQFEIKIFNRVGELLYQSNNIAEVNDTTKGWDGTYKGNLQPTGVYVYLITGKNAAGQSFERKGDITLIR